MQQKTLGVSSFLSHSRQQNYEGLTSLRGLAASLVIIVHVLGIQPLPDSFGTYYVRQFFPMGVGMFFVISAFSLCVSTIRRVGTDGWLSAFAIRRFMRIAPLFYVMALFYLLVVPEIVGGPFPWLFFAQTISFLFNLMPQEHASLVWAGWAVGVEMLFYLILPFVLVFVGGRWSSVVFVLLANLVSIMFIVHYRTADYPVDYADRSFLGSIGIFAWGILGYFIFDKLRAHRHKPAIAMVILALSVVAAGVLVATDGWHLQYPVTRALLWAPVFAGVILSQCLRPVWLLTNGFWSHLGRMSFSLYLCHPPIVYFLYPVFLKIYLAAVFPEVAFLGCILLTSLVLYPVAWLAFMAIEQPGVGLGERLIKLRLFRDNLTKAERPGPSPARSFDHQDSREPSSPVVEEARAIS